MNKNKLILAIDIDGTLIPNSSEAPNIEGIKKFGKLVKDLNAVLVYPTGRTFTFACEAIGKYFLPRPDFLITDNGVCLFSHNGSGWIENMDYAEMLSKKEPDFDNAKIIKLLSKLPFLQLEEEEKQHKIKVGFYSDLEKQPIDTVREVEDLLKSYGIEDVKIVYSHDLKNKVGILEILPDGISKLMGINYLSSIILCHPEERSDEGSRLLSEHILREEDRQDDKLVVFAGDEGNDLDVFASGIPSILVGNAREEIKNIVRGMRLDSVYFAEGNEVEGVIEGIQSIINVQ